MPTKSRARREMERLLNEATKPEQRAEFAAKLAKIAHQEGIERGRKRRAKATKTKAANKKPAMPPTEDELAEEFEFNFAPQQPPTPQTPPAAPPPVEPDEDESAAVELERLYQQNIDPTSGKADGGSRVIHAMNAPGAMYYDPVRGWCEDYDPRSTVGPQPGQQWSPLLDEPGVVTNYQWDHAAQEFTSAEQRVERARQAEEERQRRRFQPEFVPWDDEVIARVLARRSE